MRIIFVRHGETTDNARRIIQGQQHGQLSPEGRQQAETVGKKLALAFIPNTIFTSDLQRACETAAIIGEHTRSNILSEARLRERGFGAWEGRPVIGIQRAMLLQKKHLDAVEIPGAESPALFTRRIEDFILTAASLQHETIFAVTHYGVIDYLLRSRGFPADKKIENCACVLFTLQNGNLEFERILS